MKNIAVSGLTLLLLGCGGSGGSDNDASTNSGSLSVQGNQANIVVQGHAINPTKINIPFKKSGTTSNYIYTSYVSKSDAILSGEFIETSNTEGYLEVTLDAGYAIGEGESTHAVNMLFCYDTQCTKPLSGSPVKTNITYNTKLEERVSLDASASINYTKTLNARIDDNLINLPISISGDNAEKLSVSRGSEGNLINHVSMSHQSAQAYVLNIDLKLPHNLGVDQHQEELSVDICYDADCQYPIKGSPLTLPISYQIDPSQPTQDTALAAGSKKQFDVEMFDAAYIPGLNVVVMISEIPKEAVFIYDVANDSVQEIELNIGSRALYVDQLAKQGRFVVSGVKSLAIFDYDDKTSAFVHTKNIATDDYSTNKIIVRRNDLFMVDGHHHKLRKFDIDAGTSKISQTPTPFKDGIKLNRHGDAVYSSYITNHLIKANIEGKKWLKDPLVIDTPNYHFQTEVWTDRRRDVVVSSNLEYFDSSEDEHQGLIYLGTLPKPQNAAEGKTNLSSIYDAGDTYIVSDGSLIGSVREISKTDDSILHHFDATTQTVDGKEVIEHPIYVFKTDAGDIFALKVPGAFSAQLTKSTLVRLH